MTQMKTTFCQPIYRLDEAKELLRAIQRANGGRFFRYDTVMSVPNLMESIASYLHWREGEYLAPSSRRRILRSLARQIGLPSGAGGRPEEVRLDEERATYFLYAFLYLTKLGLSFEQFIDDYYSDNIQETTIDV